MLILLSVLSHGICMVCWSTSGAILRLVWDGTLIFGSVNMLNPVDGVYVSFLFKD